MKKVSINELEEGMILAKPILRGSMVILAEGAELTSSWINRIDDMGIEHLFIEGTVEQAVPLEEALALLDARFRMVDNALYMSLLKKIVKEHIEGLYHNE